MQVGACVMVAGIEAVANFAANWAYSTNVGISNTIINLPLSMVIAFLLSRFTPKLSEYHSLSVYAARFIGAAAMIVATINLPQ